MFISASIERAVEVACNEFEICVFAFLALKRNCAYMYHL